METKDFENYTKEELIEYINNQIKTSETQPKGLKKRIDFNNNFSLEKTDKDEVRDGYQLKWIGKDYARLQSGMQTETVIIPDNKHNEKDENKNSQNLFFTGDNLEVLRHLQNAYANSIKMIYIDPPYNTSGEFVYNDKFEFSDEKLKEMLDITDDEIQRLHVINGRSSHSAWLTFMYPRLKIARKLLTEDGVIFISIDDNEQANLKLLCDEIFGEENFISILPRTTKKGGKSSDNVQKNHDYVLIYSKTTDVKLEHLEHTDSGFKYSDEFEEERGKFKLNQTLDYDTLGYVNSLDYPIIIEDETFYPGNVSEDEFIQRKKTNPKDGYRWRWSKDLFDFGIKNNFIVVNKNTHRIYTKTYQNATIEINDDGEYYIEITPRKKALSSIDLLDNNYSNDNAKKELKNILGKFLFDYPKPSQLIYDLIQRISNNEYFILDFFAGSASTAHAVMKLNANDGGNRKYVLVQLPELIPNNTEGNKLGFNTIDEISRKRIQLSADKIKKETNAEIDYGFKHYYVKEADIQTINKIEEFDPNIPKLIADNMVQEFDNEFSKGKDVIFATWLVSDGYKLNEKVEVIDFEGYKAQYIDNSLLYLIDMNWSNEQTKQLLNFIGENKLNINTIIVYGYSFTLESIKELEIAIKQNFDNRIKIEKRY